MTPKIMYLIILTGCENQAPLQADRAIACASCVSPNVVKVVYSYSLPLQGEG
ncbi:hypothetical protein [Anabaena sp. CS-542/02]|uniref:hypothetical protein n=1 Tax=Anabaena sp. CS-542/02 TaxID=3021719 RepID=UPI00232FB484|nr:hypothetical protein [Anabaena sp. CS-542/02]MDB9445204.1 hypothetical protein [Anabaena sp. CS-542/02]